jgi:hypothetical protein
MKIHPVGVELFHADGRTDMKLFVVFFSRNFAQGPKNEFGSLVGGMNSLQWCGTVTVPPVSVDHSKN